MTLILPAFKLGDTATLHAPAGLTLVVTAPGGSQTTYNTATTRTDIHLTMLGTYRYRWSDGTTGELVVEQPRKPPVAP